MCPRPHQHAPGAFATTPPTANQPNHGKRGRACPAACTAPRATGSRGAGGGQGGGCGATGGGCPPRGGYKWRGHRALRCKWRGPLAPRRRRAKACVPWRGWGYTKRGTLGPSGAPWVPWSTTWGNGPGQGHKPNNAGTMQGTRWPPSHAKRALHRHGASACCNCPAGPRLGGNAPGPVWWGLCPPPLAPRANGARVGKGPTRPCPATQTGVCCPLWPRPGGTASPPGAGLA